MTLQEYIDNRNQEYDLMILSLNIELSVEAKEKLELQREDLENQLNSLLPEDREMLEDEYTKYFEESMDEYYTQLAIDYENKLKEEGFVIDIENPEIIRLTGRITTQNGNSFCISHKSIDIDFKTLYNKHGVNYKAYKTRNWMSFFDLETDSYCKKDEDEFSVEFLRKIN